MAAIMLSLSLPWFQCEVLLVALSDIFNVKSMQKRLYNPTLQLKIEARWV